MTSSVVIKNWLAQNSLEKYFPAIQKSQYNDLNKLVGFNKKAKKRFYDSIKVAIDDRGKFGEALFLLKQDGVEKYSQNGCHAHENGVGSDSDVEDGEEDTESSAGEEDVSGEEGDTDDIDDSDSDESKRKAGSKHKKRSKYKNRSSHNKKSKHFIRKKRKKKVQHSDSESSSDESSSEGETGRESDDEYEMEFDKIADVLKEGVKYEVPQDAEWKPLRSWKKPDGFEEIDAKFYEVPLSKKLAGSIHKIALYYFKPPSGEICKRLVKIARSSDEDKKEHFENELHVNHYLSTIGEAINNSFASRTDVCVWPVETVELEVEGELKFALAQAPFLPPDMYEFVKVEPNNGEILYNDRVVGRYQHAFAAFSRGLSMIRDWQGFGVPRCIFVEQCKLYCPEAINQIRDRPPHVKGTEVLVSIDPVLITSRAHFIADNATDFGIASMDEWQETHDCGACRCHAFKLLPEICWGLADVDQKFFEDCPAIEQAATSVCSKLGIWMGDELQ